MTYVKLLVVEIIECIDRTGRLEACSAAEDQ